MERLQYLLRRRLDGTLTAAEEAELAEASPAELAEIMANLIEAEPHIPVDEETLQHSFQRLMLRDRIIERPRRYYSLMASIAALFALAIAGWFLLRKPEPVRIVTPFAVAPIIPGGNKAVLTLANGRQIVLDSAGNGDLAQEGGVRVVKMDSGLLSYRGSGGTSAAGEYNTLSTPRGGQYQLVLPDGTRVWLNSASSLRYPLSFASGREVELTGEAYFDVARNAGSPFVVKAPHSRVEVLGTAFNLMAYPDESHTRTTLINGAVKVVQGGFSTIIKPGEQAAVDNKAGTIDVQRPDLEEVVAWKDGRFQFGNTSLRTIMRQMERWYDVDVEYRRNVDSVFFTGRISRKQYAAQLLEVLEMDGRVHFTTEGRKIIVK